MRMLDLSLNGLATLCVCSMHRATCHSCWSSMRFNHFCSGIAHMRRCGHSAFNLKRLLFSSLDLATMMTIARVRFVCLEPCRSPSRVDPCLPTAPNDPVGLPQHSQQSTRPPRTRSNSEFSDTSTFFISSCTLQMWSFCSRTSRTS